jgi:hypothetical protein
MAVRELQLCFAIVPQCFQDHKVKLLRNRDDRGYKDRRFCFTHGDLWVVFSLDRKHCLTISDFGAEPIYSLLSFPSTI